jgi:hypothetical protein
MRVMGFSFDDKTGARGARPLAPIDAEAYSTTRFCGPVRFSLRRRDGS